MSARPLAIALLALLGAAGCVSNDAPASEVETASAAPIDGPRPELAAPTFLPNVLLDGTLSAAEPNIAVAQDGTVYVTSPLALWRSDDGGSTFQGIGEPICRLGTPAGPPPVCPPGYEGWRPGMVGGGDGDIAIGDNGTLYWLGLFAQDAPIPFQVSTDRGETWSEAVDLAEGNSTDREWIDAAPGGIVYATWRDFGGDESNPQLLFRRSNDSGATWGPLVPIREDALQGPLVHAPREPSTLYTAFTTDGSVEIARSLDAGDTWTTHAITDGTRDLTLRLNNPTWLFPVVAVDDAGTVYAVWGQDDPSLSVMGAKETARPTIFFSTSKDLGESWSEPLAVSTPGKSALMPWIVAGAPGRVAIAFYENAVGLPSEVMPDLWNVALLESVDADADAPTFVGGYANDEPFHVGAICSEGGSCQVKDRSRLDFFEMALTNDGQPILVWTADSDVPRRIQLVVGGVAEGTPFSG